MNLEEVKKPNLYSLSQVAKFMGLHENTLYRMIKDGRMKAVKHPGKGGGTWKFRAEDVQEYYDRIQNAAAVQGEHK